MSLAHIARGLKDGNSSSSRLKKGSSISLLVKDDSSHSSGSEGRQLNPAHSALRRITLLKFSSSAQSAQLQLSQLGSSQSS
ncbi:hypothetical protein V6N12_033976 [Hibiscus sabdariffa]|uniref:Uncharacterized protein n=1 Tax=Hibiscus sabdariffa TaxID=183260 RepID=A0ABR2A9N4_9ROSI